MVSHSCFQVILISMCLSLKFQHLQRNRDTMVRFFCKCEQCSSQVIFVCPLQREERQFVQEVMNSPI